ncbi:MAG: hypothetical protein ACT4NL_05560 [Pseudomarimonas sp.]
MLIRALRLPLFAVFALLVAALPARAYTPESGVWWNPNEPGTGMFMEIQDNFVAISLFVGTPTGTPTWYTSTGFLAEDSNALYVGTLDYFPGAQCIGCPFRPVTPQINAGGAIRVVFNANDPTRATLTIGGRTTNIERFRFYFKRPEDEQALPGVSANLTRLMGEWQAVLDYSGTANGAATYFGDVLIFDNLDFDNAGDFVDGCRPAESVGGFCSNTDLDLRYANAAYVAADGTHVIVVENSASTFASYFIELGTNQFEGEVAVYNRGSNPTVFFPARGFRSASRTFVEEGTGPSRKATGTVNKGLPLTSTTVADGKTSTRSKESLDRLNAVRAQLEAQLVARRAKHSR